ncbi:hypothetical protein C8T65DRAFT_693752 [Cerioporus squamosus]|nr:hypothetical protein C8T65DRAFT_693752 [Cerioporus squamosus]
MGALDATETRLQCEAETMDDLWRVVEFPATSKYVILGIRSARRDLDPVQRFAAVGNRYGVLFVVHLPTIRIRNASLSTTLEAECQNKDDAVQLTRNEQVLTDAPATDGTQGACRLPEKRTAAACEAPVPRLGLAVVIDRDTGARTKNQGSDVQRQRRARRSLNLSLFSPLTVVMSTARTILYPSFAFQRTACTDTKLQRLGGRGYNGCSLPEEQSKHVRGSSRDVDIPVSRE